ncbi:tRNA (uracil(54)-C(5))-methyltransferase [Smittium culicis]|uniref:tRNA (Uracil(54)-C(5))-methyltransferase n=1 Tax=Smittium culicis TaxID=133412 RepID=A0A1R1XX05_9FUNG|nr:tRNA (uracil(54)-C(5))-methyltransferase [Smittium culicis]
MNENIENKRKAEENLDLDSNVSNKRSQIVELDTKGEELNSFVKVAKKKLNGKQLKFLKKNSKPEVISEIKSFYSELLELGIKDLKTLNQKVWFNSNAQEELEWCTNPPLTAAREYIVSKENVEKTETKTETKSDSTDIEKTKKPEPLKPAIVNLYVHKLLTNGLGLSTVETKEELLKLVKGGNKAWFYAVPFALPGEYVKAKVIDNSWGYSLCDLVDIVSNKSEKRIQPECKYFGKCSGCQLQMVDYKTQLEFKKEFVKSVFDLENPELMSSLKDCEFRDVVNNATKGFGYRTKITPHFEIFKWLPKSQTSIGFNYTNRREIMDIEECVIGTKSVNEGLSVARKNTMEKIEEYVRGATLLIRETNIVGDNDSKKAYVLSPKEEVEEIIPIVVAETTEPSQVNKVLNLLDDLSSSENKDSILKAKKLSEAAGFKVEIKNLRFKFLASSFFQNNNLILPKLVYHTNLLINQASEFRVLNGYKKITQLADVYCGAGLFGISMSYGFESVVGIEISKESIKNAVTNSALNNITNCSFSQGDATDIFAKIKPNHSKESTGSASENVIALKKNAKGASNSSYPKGSLLEDAITDPANKNVCLDPSTTAVIIDPPRKGSTEEFLKQLVDYGPAAIIYIACGVPAQARDLNYLIKQGFIVQEYPEDTSESNLSRPDDKTNKKAIYKISSVTPFDLFPQTYHVENVVALIRLN